MRRNEKHRNQFDEHCTYVSGKFYGNKIMSANQDNDFINSSPLREYYELRNCDFYQHFSSKFEFGYDINKDNEVIRYWNKFLTQRCELWIEDNWIRTPLIKIGEFPTVMYDIYQMFIQKYEPELKEIKRKARIWPNEFEPKILEENLEYRWKNMSGKEIDNLRTQIQETQKNKEKLNLLSRIHKNLNIIELWESLRKNNPERQHFKYGWDCDDKIRNENIENKWEML